MLSTVDMESYLNSVRRRDDEKKMRVMYRRHVALDFPKSGFGFRLCLTDTFQSQLSCTYSLIFSAICRTLIPIEVIVILLLSRHNHPGIG